MSRINGNDNQNMIRVYVTDLRNSILKGKKAKQKKLLVENIIILGCDSASLSNLEKAIGIVLTENKIGGNKKFVTYNTDTIRIDTGNVGKLENGDNLILFDSDQTGIPAGYEHIETYQILPHTRAVTNQEGKFYGLEEHNVGAFAIAEFVDNSLTATANNKERRKIQIEFHNNGSNSYLAVLDNGCGMNSEMLQTGLKFKAPKDSRPNDVSDLPTQSVNPGSDEEAAREEIHPIFLNSNISKFGAGLKQAVFWLGDDAKIITKRAESRTVYEVHYSRENMEAKESAKSEDAWNVAIKMRDVSELKGVQVPPLLKALIEARETSEPSFTYIMIQNLIKGDATSPLQFLQQQDSSLDVKPSIEKQLAHIYHYYLHGRDGNTGKESMNGTMVDIEVTRFDSTGKKVSSINLRELVEANLDLESRFVRTAASDPFRFTIEVLKSQRVNGPMIPKLRLGGIIRYHPYEYYHETYPVNKVANISGSLDPRDVNSDQTLQPMEDKNYRIDNKDFFHLWWNGRLIPCTKLDAFPWCSPSERGKNPDKLYKSYGRISGSLFLDGHICEITDNKLNLTTTTKISEIIDKKIHSVQSTFKLVKSHGNTLKAKRVGNDVRKAFEAWLTTCQKYDKEVCYTNVLRDSQKGPIIRKVRFQTYFEYGAAEWKESGIKLQVGDAVQLKTSSIILGKIKSFYVQFENCLLEDEYVANSSTRPLPEVHAPVSYFDIEHCPAPYYARDGEEIPIRRKRMSQIDTTRLQVSVEELIARQADELNLKFEIIKGPIPEFGNGFKIKSDGILFKSLGLDIVKVNGEGSVEGYLPFCQPRKKHIFVVTQIHKIDNNNKRELCHTMESCNYSRPATNPHGYYFNTFAVTKLGCSKIGDYIITFRAYISEQPFVRATQSRVATVMSRNTPSGRATPNRLIDPPYEIEWEQEVDFHGRKILKDGEKKIRLPYYEIKYSVVAGLPDKFKIEAFDNEDHHRIGIGFKMNVSFKDSNGNAASAKNLESELTTLTQQLKISLVPIKKSQNFNLTITYGALSIEGDQLVINNVIASGFLNAADFKEGRIDVEMTLNNRTKTSSSSKIRFYSGFPVRIECLEKHVEIENGCRPGLSCRVLDCGGNVVVANEEDKKPITLRCRIIKKTNHQFACERTILATNSVCKTNEVIDVDEFKKFGITQVDLLCEISCELYSNIKPVLVPITIKRSTRAEKLLVYRRSIEDEQNTVEICDKSVQFIQILKELYLSYKLFDGMGNPVVFDESKYKVNVSWSKNACLENGILPTHKVPKRAEEKTEFRTTLQILGFEEELKHIFYLTSLPLEPDTMSVSFVGGNNSRDLVQLPMGEKLPAAVVKIMDRWSNIILYGLRDEELSIEVDCSREEEFQVAFDPVREDIDNGGSFLVKDLDISIPSGRNLPIGEMVLKVTFRDLSSDLKLSVTTGYPKKLGFVINDQKQKQRGTFTCQNGSEVRIFARLLDAFNNFTISRTPIEVKFLQTQDGVTVIEKKIMMSADGVVDFGVICPDVKTNPNRYSSCVVKVNDCRGRCFGKPITVTVMGNVDGHERSDVCHFHVTCRSDFPYQLIPHKVEGLGPFRYEAGSSFTNLTVTLLSEDGTKYTSAEKEKVSLHLKPTNGISGVHLEPILASGVHEGIYTFDQVPPEAGNYEAKFCYQNGTVEISEILKEPLEIYAGSVHALKPETDLRDLSVSNNSENDEDRIIVENLKLIIVDRFGNVCTEGENSDDGNSNLSRGDVTIDFPGEMKLQNLENCTTLSSKIALINGYVSIPKLAVVAGLPLPNNSKHTIRFILKMESSSEFVFPLEFTFFNNSEQMAANRKLREEIATLEGEIANKKQSFQSSENSMMLIQAKIEGLRERERQEKEILKNISSQEFVETLKMSKDVTDREACLKTTEKELEGERNMTKSNIPPGPGAGEPNVFGPIGLLAEIKRGGDISIDLNLRRILSWHLQNKLSVIVTATSKTGRDLEKLFPKEQFMLLDIIKDYPPNTVALSGPGNPVYARTLLNFTKPEATAATRKVLNKILGDTIIMDDLPTAIDFMKKYNQGRYNCPTILTMDGRRLTSDGIIGGSATHVPKSVRFSFGLASGVELAQIQEQLKILPTLKKIMEEAEQVERTDGPRLKSLRASCIKSKENIGKLEERRMKVVERLEGSMPRGKNQPRRTRLTRGEDHEITNKKARRT